jgi:hypothetical protein
VISYALFGPVAREFFEKREAGDLLEKEVVAAIAAVLAGSTNGRQPAAEENGNGHIEGSRWIADRRWQAQPAWRQG